MVETWSNGDNQFHISGYVKVSGSSRKKHEKARRNSGRISIYAKSTIRKGVSKMKNEHIDIQWIKLNKDFFRLQRTLFLATVYVSPENSSGKVPDLESVYATLLDNVQ